MDLGPDDSRPWRKGGVVGEFDVGDLWKASFEGGTRRTLFSSAPVTALPFTRSTTTGSSKGKQSITSFKRNTAGGFKFNLPVWFLKPLSHSQRNRSGASGRR